MRCALVVLAGLMFAGCSLSAQIATQPPAGRSKSEIAQDVAQCEAYAKEHPEHQHDRYYQEHRYQACMLARSYATNVFLKELDWIVGVKPTRPHDPLTVATDMSECDQRADNTKSAEDVPPMSPEQERIIYVQAKPMNRFDGVYRPNASRMLVFCLQERGYEVVPWVQH